MKDPNANGVGPSGLDLISRRQLLRIGAFAVASLAFGRRAGRQNASASARLGLGCMLRQDTVNLNLHYAAYTPGIVWSSSRGLPSQYYPALGLKGRYLLATSLQGLQTMAERAAGTVEYDGLGYNPERGATPPDELADIPAAMAQARVVADEYGKLLLAGPGGMLMQEHPEWYSQVAELCDVYYMQTGIYQDLGLEAYRDAVSAIVDQLLGREAWAQLVVMTSPFPHPAEELVRFGKAIAPLVRGITILDRGDPAAPETLVKVYRMIAGP